MVTALAFLLVFGVVVAATLLSSRPEPRPTTAPPAVASRPSTATHGPGIEFATAEGTGRLVVLDHTWGSGGTRRGHTPDALQVQVQIICTSGQVSYDPSFFQLFDATGQLYDVEGPGSTAGWLEIGTLEPGERTHGKLVFELPRGEVTLVMRDDTEQSVTALRISD